MEDIVLDKQIIKRTPISVAMATYNGEAYIVEQIKSIIIQFEENDELVISYDESCDRTYEIITNLSKEHKCIKVIRNQKKIVSNNLV